MMCICVIFEAYVYTKIYSWGSLKHNIQHLAQCHVYVLWDITSKMIDYPGVS